MTQWRGLLIFFLLFFPLPFPPSLTGLGCISDPIQCLSFCPLLLFIWEGLNLFQDLAAFYTQLMVNFSSPQFPYCFRHCPPQWSFPCSFLSSVFTAEHCSSCCYFPYSISQKWVLLLGNTLPVSSVDSQWEDTEEDTAIVVRLVLLLYLFTPFPKIYQCTTLDKGLFCELQHGLKDFCVVQCSFTSIITFLHLALTAFFSYFRRIASCIKKTCFPNCQVLVGVWWWCVWLGFFKNLLDFCCYFRHFVLVFWGFFRGICYILCVDCQLSCLSNERLPE